MEVDDMAIVERLGFLAGGTGKDAPTLHIQSG
jgi:hypothetical protein